MTNMKKKIRWKLLGSLRVHHFTCPVRWSSQNSAFLFTISLLFSFVILNVDAKVKSDRNITPNDNSQILKSILSTSQQSFEIHNVSLPDQVPKKLCPIDCHNLHMGQFICPQAEIDLETQQPIGCLPINLAPVNCTLRSGLICADEPEDAYYYTGAKNSTRYVRLAVACDYTNGYSFEITLLLSIFLGFLGADRFYLGYGAIGLLKMSTLGFLFLGQFIDIILIAMQIVMPADGSNYIIKQFGPRLNILKVAGVYPLPSENVTRVFDSQYDHYFYYPDNYTGT